MAHAIGIDVGGTGIKGALVDTELGELLTARVRVPTPHPSTPRQVTQTVSNLVGGIDAPGAVGVTLPAVVRSGIVETASNIDRSWIGTDATGLLATALGRPVVVVNDADAAGLAEIRWGAGRDARGTVVVITLGTGIGSALFVDGCLIPNTELGHLKLHHGDAEDWAADSVRKRDDLSWRAWAARVDAYLHTLEALLWPTLIIIGGGVSKKADKFLPHLTVRTPVVAAQLHNEAGVAGAALLADSLHSTSAPTSPLAQE
jgi:polyphosphate glucokinase